MKQVILYVLTTIFTLNVPAIHARTTSLVTEKLSPAKHLSAHTQQRLNSNFHRYSVYQPVTNITSSSLPEGEFRLQLTLGQDMDFVLDMKPHNLISPNYLVRSIGPQGTRIVPSNAPETFIVRSTDGTVKGRLSYDGTSYTGMLNDEKGFLFLEPLNRIDKSANPSTLLTYRSEDVIDANVKCGVESHGNEYNKPLSEGLKKFAPENTNAGCQRAQIAFAIDYSMIEGHGSREAVETRILEIMNGVEFLYSGEGLEIGHVVSEMVFEESDLDTWGAFDDFTDNLNQVLTWGHSAKGFVNEFDVAAMWYYQRPVSGVGGYAATKKMCHPTDNGVVIKDFSENYLVQVQIKTHELGHSWGSPHVRGSTNIMHFFPITKGFEWYDESLDIIVDHKNSVAESCLEGCDAAPVADFNHQLLTCHSKVYFKDRSMHTPTVWEWDFGDGNTSPERNPVHYYKNNGTYSVTLKTTNEFGNDQVTQQSVINIDAPLSPKITRTACTDNEVTLTAESTGNVNWYSQLHGGPVLAAGKDLKVPQSNASRIFYAETVDGAADGDIQKFGPSDHKANPGEYSKSFPRVYFDVLAPVELVGMKVIAERAGERHFVLSKGDTIIGDTLMPLKEGIQEIDFNWRIYELGEYELHLNRTLEDPVYFYKNTEGVSYPQKIDDLISVTRSFHHDADPNATSWYIGYDWRVKAISPCASARVPINLLAQCGTVSVQKPRRHPYSTSEIQKLGRLFHLEVRDLKGKEIISLVPQSSSNNLESMLDLLPKGRYYWVTLRGVEGELTRKWLSL